MMSNTVSRLSRSGYVTPESRAESRGIMGNVLSLSSGEIASRAVTLAAIMYLSRRLGPAEFGIVGFANAITSYFAIAVGQGLSRVGARDIARTPMRAASLAVSTTAVRLALAAGAFALLAAVALLLPKPMYVRLVVLLSGLTLFARALDTTWVYKGLERGRPVAAALVGGQLLFLIIVLLLVRGPADVTRVPVASFAGEALAMLALLAPFAYGVQASRAPVRLREGAALLRASAVPTFTGMVRIIIFTFDVVLLGFWASAADLGLYTAAYRICFLLLAISTSIQASYLPHISRAVADGADAIGRAASSTLATAAVIGIPLVTGGMMLAEPIMRIVFGSAYAGGSLALRILLPSIGFIFLHAVAGSTLVALGRVKLEWGIMSLGAVLNILLNIVLIPRYGIVGAAWATLASEGLILLLCAVALRRLRISVNVGGVARPAVAAGVMVLVIVVIGTGRPLLLDLVVGAVAYVAVLAAIGGIPDALRGWLAGATGPR